MGAVEPRWTVEPEGQRGCRAGPLLMACNGQPGPRTAACPALGAWRGGWGGGGSRKPRPGLRSAHLSSGSTPLPEARTSTYLGPQQRLRVIVSRHEHLHYGDETPESVFLLQIQEGHGHQPAGKRRYGERRPLQPRPRGRRTPVPLVLVATAPPAPANNTKSAFLGW